MTEFLQDLLTRYAIAESFQILGVEASTVTLLTIYAVAAIICLVYIFLSLTIGSLAELAHIGDGSTFPGIAAALGVFSALGGLSLFLFDATPQGSIVYGIVGGIITLLSIILTMGWVQKNQGNAVMTAESLEGLSGSCNMSMSASQAGQVMVVVNGCEEILKAWSQSQISKGDKIRVVGVRNAREVDVVKI